MNRSQQQAERVAPADGLRLHHAAVAEIDLRLVEHLDLAARERVAQPARATGLCESRFNSAA
jgi:hypothetical protein